MGDYKEFHIDGGDGGVIKWHYIELLHEAQENHGLRAGNKLTKQHIFYRNKKMKVNIALQTVASRSVARALKWAHDSEIQGFENKKDVYATADFIELHDNLFNTLNSHSPYAPGYHKALTPENLKPRQEVFNKVRDLYEKLDFRYWDPKTNEYKFKKLIHTRRKTGFLGILTCMYALEIIVIYMENGTLGIKFLLTYKLNQGKIY